MFRWRRDFAELVVEVGELHKREDSLTLEQRRARYKCRDKFIAQSALPIWSDNVAEALQEGP